MSHAQESLVVPLLGQLAAQRDPLVTQVILTHNLPARAVPAPPDGWPFAFLEVFNKEPASFAINHNRAFSAATGEYFCVLNPDIDLYDRSVWSQLATAASRPGVGCAYPVLLDTDGNVQDNEREAVTPMALVRRHLLRSPQMRADWASGAFWLVPVRAWRDVGGLDEGFRMYCEDTDFCLRLQLAGWTLARVPAQARHAAARASRNPGLRMAWHVMSLLRLWARPPLWRYVVLKAKAASKPGPNARQ